MVRGTQAAGAVTLSSGSHRPAKGNGCARTGAAQPRPRTAASKRVLNATLDARFKAIFDIYLLLS
jgi:hypothetical protein